MVIKPFRKTHIEDAAGIVLEGYLAERAAVPALPALQDCKRLLMKEMEDLADGASGIPGFAATEGGKLVGFLSGYPVNTFFSSRNGVYVPVTGQGASGPDRRLVYQKLYEAASGAWVGEGRLVHCLSMFAHDAEAVDAWYWLGFGLRCVDAVRPLAPLAGARASDLEIRKAAPENAEALFALHTEHCGYYRNAPLFMPRVDVESRLEEFRQWLMEDGQHLWAAWRGETPVSYMRIQQGGGNCFATRDLQAYHITGAFTTGSARGTGAGAQLLSAIVGWAKEQGCERLSVDYESFNIYGSRFWGKHFTPFLFSAVRNIDDRIIETANK